MEVKYGRKRSLIIKHLSAKLEDWLSTIDDEVVRDELRDNVIVTGGSIASMMMGDKINDYDVYFKTIEATTAAAKYYSLQFSSNNPGSIEANVSVDTMRNIKGVSEERVVIFIKSSGITEEVETTAKEAGKRYRPIFLSQNAITLSDSVQLVTRFYGSPTEIHSNYDFVHAMCYYDYKNNNLVMPGEALESMMSRTLYYKGSLYPIASIFRMKKFLERGWRISAGQQLKIMWQISEIDLSVFEVLKEQLTGVDQAYLYMLIESLKNVSSDKINSNYVGTVIDRIFD